MCGIVGIVNKSDCIQDIISGLYSLEYRGYDSSGVATIASPFCSGVNKFWVVTVTARFSSDIDEMEKMLNEYLQFSSEKNKEQTEEFEFNDCGQLRRKVGSG